MTELAESLDDGAIKLRRVTGILLLFAALTTTLAAVLSDPAIEEHHVGKLFIQQVERAADRAPTIYVFQVVDVVRGFLTAAAGVGLWLILRVQAPGFSLAGLVMFAMSGVFAAGTAFIGAATTNAAQLYVGGHLEGIGAGSSDLLAMIQVFTILHFGFFLTAFAALGLGIAAFSRSLAWSNAAPRWVSRLGLASGALLCTSWLTFINELLFLPFFVGGLLLLVWLITTGIRLTRSA
jgi:hypothetical protein